MADEEWVKTPKGIYVVTKKLAQPGWILGRKKTLQDSIIDLNRQLKEIQVQIATKELLLKKLGAPAVIRHVKRMKRKQEIAQTKAQRLLKEYVGEAAFKAIKEQGKIQYTPKDGPTYQIDKRGRVFRKDTVGWVELCIIRPKDLPFPDFILSMLVNLKQNHKRFVNPRRRG